MFKKEFVVKCPMLEYLANSINYRFVHHEERIGIRALGNWLYSYYDKVMMRITLNILKV